MLDCTCVLASYNDAQMNLSWMSTSGGKQLPGVVFRKDPSQLDGIFLIEDYSYGKEKRSFGESGKINETTDRFNCWTVESTSINIAKRS